MAHGSGVDLQCEGPGFQSQPGLLLHVLPVNAWVLCTYSTPATSHSPKKQDFRLFGLTKLSLSVSVCVHDDCPVSLCVAVRWTRDTSRVYPASQLMTVRDMNLQA